MPAKKLSLSSPAENIASMSDILLPGASPVGYIKPEAGQNIQTVTPTQFTEIQSQLLDGTSPVTTPSGYNGTWYERSDGTVFGIRTNKQNGATIDVIKSNNPEVPPGFKVHQQ